MAPAKLPVLFLFLMKSATGTKSESGPIAKTQFGAVSGTYSKEAAVFFGLPFAMPPVEELRWKAPQPFNNSWAPNVYDATFPRYGCYQVLCHNTSILEEKLECPRDDLYRQDCLYLNIFTPLPFNPADKLPVAIWFPGKRYIYGSASYLLLDGRFLANKTRAIIVTTNYRLGALGFLVAGEGEGAATGNYGTLDQIAAMQWVQSNIGSFGGDKDQVTIMGQSSGADSVALHLMAENTAHLFKRAVMMSIPFIDHKSRKQALRLSKVVARHLHCAAGDMACLRAAEPHDVTEAQHQSQQPVPSDITQQYVEWGPYVDGNIVKTSNLQDMFLQGKFQKKPFIIGTATHDAVPMIYEAWKNNMTETLFEQIILHLFLEKAQLVQKEYPPAPSGDQRPILSSLATDLLYVCPARRVIRSAPQAGLSDVWLYHFDQMTEDKGVNLWGNDTECYTHVCHGSEIPFLFQTLKLAGLNVTDDEQATANSMAYFFGNFIHTGDPNNSGRHQVHPSDPRQPSRGISWPKYNKLNNYVNIRFTAPAIQLEPGYLAEKCDFWDKNFPPPVFEENHT